jgi:hypothetical protein
MRQLWLSVIAGGFLCLLGCDSESNSFGDGYSSTGVEILDEGNAPLTGMDSKKGILVIDNEDDLATHWYDYSVESLPNVDFQNELVVIYDRGTIDFNACSEEPTVSGVSASVDAHNRVTLLDIELTRVCVDPEVNCTAEYIAARPYKILKLARTRDIFVSENYNEQNCN